MAPSKTCPQCELEVDLRTSRCPHCGASLRPEFLRRAMRVLLIVAGLACVVFVTWWTVVRGRRKTPVDTHVAAEIVPKAGPVAFEVPGAMQLGYHDVGANVEIIISANAMPILYVDVDKQGGSGSLATGKSFAAFPDGKTCVQTIQTVDPNGSETAQCGNASSSAVARVTPKPGGGWLVAWTIPKRELTPAGDSADVSIQIFRESDQQGTYHPAPPFSQVYRLRFSQNRGSEVARPVIESQTQHSSSIAKPIVAAKLPDKYATTTPTIPQRSFEKRKVDSESDHETEMKRQLAALQTNQQEQERQLSETRALLAEEKARNEQARLNPGPVNIPVMPPTPSVSYSGPTSGMLIWQGEVRGTELIDINNGSASAGVLTGALPGVPCMLQPEDSRKIAIATAPGPANEWKRVVFRVKGNGRMTVRMTWVVALFKER